MRSRALPLVLCALLVTGCTAGGGAGGGAAAVELSAPPERLTVVADVDPVAAAVSSSRTFFRRSGVAVVAGAADRAGILLASSAAVGLGVPLLLVPASGSASAVTDELDRLGVTDVLAVGDVELPPADGGPEVLGVPATASAVGGATGLSLDETVAVPAGGDAAALASLDGGTPVALVPERGKEAAEDSSDGSLPRVERADPVAGTVVLATGDPPAGIATARAAGAQVVVTGGATDPRASAEVLDALAGRPDAGVVALGAGFAAEDGLEWKTATAATGRQLPGGGQLLFPGRLLVALYGHPGTASLGIMGEQPVEQAIERARAHAAPYEPLVDATVVPAFEIIATVASSAAGDDGDYSAEADPGFLRPWVEAAGEAGLYVILDLQPGRTDFVAQAEQYRSLLELPHVGLALDPEWRLGPGEVHLTQIGSVDIEEVNAVVTWLADLTREAALPQKLLVLHQFRLDMVRGRERLDTSRDELALMVHADGQGGQGDKQATWAALHRNAPQGLWWGWKNFYDEDTPMLTPAQTIGGVAPVPQLISYQ